MIKLKCTEKVQKYPNEVSDNPLVSVCVQTYKHEKYIKQCLDGILMQKTNFEFEILLGEDDSPDKTREICIDYAEKYPNKIKLFLHNRENVIYINGNPTGRFNFIYNLTNAKGKYIAICEGDDYWTDPLKLQKQVDFLEANPEYGLVHTDLNVLHQKQNIITRSLYKNIKLSIPIGKIYNELLVKNTISTLTVMFRNSFIKDILKNEKEIFSFGMGDYPLWLKFSLNYKIGFINESTVMYRKLGVSASHNLDIDKLYKLRSNIFKVRSYFIKKYGCDERTKKEVDKNLYIFNLDYGFKSRNKKIAEESFFNLKDINQDDFDAKLKYYGTKSSINWNVVKLYYRFKGKKESLLNRIVSKR